MPKITLSVYPDAVDDAIKRLSKKKHQYTQWDARLTEGAAWWWADCDFCGSRVFVQTYPQVERKGNAFTSVCVPEQQE